ncbi:protein NYNRIN-like [Grus japonensis]|uniref:Protein NYNRIN-like n=1 Tax=Grus japonensis TaxID=30415 RepID=A0ABC9VZ45_GRUJA
MQLTWTVLPQGFKNNPTIFGNQLAKELEMQKKQNEGQGNIWPLECWRNGWDPGSDQWDTSLNNLTTPDLKDEPLKNPDLELFTDGSSFVQEGRRMAGYAVVTIDKVLESGTLPANTSAQKAELVALKQALRVAEGKRVNIWTDSKYAFGVIHAHEAIWKERGLLSAQGSPIRHKEEVLQLLQDVQKLKEVAVMHCKTHQFAQMVIDWQTKLQKRLQDKVSLH